MKKEIRKVDNDSVLDILIGTRVFVKPARPVGRLKQLNKNAKKMKRLYSPVIETDADNQN